MVQNIGESGCKYWAFCSSVYSHLSLRPARFVCALHSFTISWESQMFQLEAVLNQRGMVGQEGEGR